MGSQGLGSYSASNADIGVVPLVEMARLVCLQSCRFPSGRVERRFAAP
jgi:hypothetical protein